MKAIKKLFKSIWIECKDWKTFILFCIVYLVLILPTIIGFIIYWMFKLEWALIMATSYIAFWALPATPLIPICLAITFGIKKIGKKLCTHREKDDVDV